MKLRTVVFAGLLSFAGWAQAAPVFEDNFDANTPAVNTVPTGWFLGGGTVDIIGSGFLYDYVPGNGLYVDLDGSTSEGGTLFKFLNLTGGTTYQLSFDLAGNNVPGGGYPSDIVDVTFGSAAGTYTLDPGDGFSTRTLSFTAGGNGSFALLFHNRGGDNAGALLDNVSVTAVPEPETYAMLLAGLGAIGFMQRRRQAREQAKEQGR